MPLVQGAAPSHPAGIPVIDFRRQSMMLEWDALRGSWTACDEPPALVHGIALIRAAQPNICIYGRGGRLYLQIGTDQYALSESTPRLKFLREAATAGLRRRFVVESSSGEELASHTYWRDQGDEFFLWLMARAADPAWRSDNERRWSDGLDAAALRSLLR